MTITLKTAKCLPITDSEEKARLGDWLLIAGRTRDSDALAESNFAAVLRTLGGESETVEVLRFHHWACGWVEEIAVHPSRRAEVEAIAERLEDYPVLDEDDFSAREDAEAWEGWLSFAARDFARHLQHQYDLTDDTFDLLCESPELLYETFQPWLEQECGEYNWRQMYQVSRGDLARLLRSHAKRLRAARKTA